MHKEKITKEIIKKDLIKRIRNQFIILLFTIISLMIISCITYWGFKKPEFTFDFIFATICAVTFIIISIISIVETTKNIISTINTNNFKVVTDELINPEDEIYFRTRRKIVYHIYHLHFSSFGKYTLPEKNYSWSSEYSMKDKGVYETSSKGDEFYLVISKDKTQEILLVYNKKLFELE